MLSPVRPDSSQIASEQAALQAVAQRVCAAPEAIRVAPDKDTGRARLEEALAATREGRAILASLTGKAAEISGLSGTDAGNGAEAAAARVHTMDGAAEERELGPEAEEYFDEDELRVVEDDAGE